MFSNRDLKRLIIPLIIEQILIMTIGVADTVMVAGVGEVAVSAVSLVDSVNILIINVFAALSTGGAVVAAQFIGRMDGKNASAAAKQLVLVVISFGLLAMAVFFLAGGGMLELLFGEAEPAVMEQAKIYFRISALSYPFIGLYNCGTALFRSMGNSKISMVSSLIMNVVNIGANFTCIYLLNMGVAGAGIGSLIARAVSAVIVMLLLRRSEGIIRMPRLMSLDFQPVLVKNILAIGVPNGIENGMFQIGKILVQGLVASFGTVALTANAVSMSVANIAIIPGMAIGLAMTTVVGQCIGAGREDEAQRNIKKLLGAAVAILGVLNLAILFAVPLVLRIFQLSAQTAQEASKILVYHSVCCIVIWAVAFTLPNGLRAANDVKFTMLVSIFSMWVFRIGFSYVLGKYAGIGVFGVWVAMTIDWLVRSAFFATRFISGKWKGRSLI